MRRLLVLSLTLSLWGCGSPSGPVVADTEGTRDTTVTEPQDSGSDGAILDASSDSGSLDAAKPPALYTLVDNTGWSVVPLDADPFHIDGDPKPDLCPEEEVLIEQIPGATQVEVDTTFCAYITFKQALLEDVPEGAALNIIIAHGMVLDGWGDYRLAIAMGEPAQVVWEKVVTVGTLDAIYDEAWSSPATFEKGDSVYFHVSNHGTNHWALRRLTAEY